MRSTNKRQLRSARFLSNKKPAHNIVLLLLFFYLTISAGMLSKMCNSAFVMANGRFISPVYVTRIEEWR